MPFTPADAPKYDKAANSPAKKRMWASIANAVLKKHNDDGMAIRVANSKVESMLHRQPLLVEDGQRRMGDHKLKKSRGKMLFKDRVKKFFKQAKKTADQWAESPTGLDIRRAFHDPRLGR